MIARINKQLREKGIELLLTPAARAALVDKGYDPTYGARQLRRTIQKHIEDPLAEAIVRGRSRRARGSRSTSRAGTSCSARLSRAERAARAAEH